jgi:hypothetical protein
MSRPKPSSRENGRLSQGPKTQAGKDRAKFNALRHGLSAQQAVVLANESHEDFDYLLDMHLQRFQPDDYIEAELVAEMASARWRTRRLRSMETGLMDRAILQLTDDAPAEPAGAAFSILAQGRTLDLLLRYEARLQLSYQRSIRTLIQLHEHLPAEQFLEEPSAATQPPAPAVASHSALPQPPRCFDTAAPLEPRAEAA